MATILAFGALCAGIEATRAADLILTVTVAGRPQPGFGNFTERDGHLLARPDDLDKVGIALPDGVAVDEDGLVALDDVSGLSYALDFGEQAVAFEVDFALLSGTDVQLVRSAAPAAVTPAVTALVLNYDATVSSDSTGALHWGSFLGARVSTPWGVGETTGFVRGGGAEDGAADEFVRMDSWFETYLPESTTMFRLGDGITSGLIWTRPVRFGGFLARSNFATRPDLVTTPLAAFEGTAEVPSAVDVVINGIRQASYDVAPGPFHIADVPVVTGSGQVSLVIRDALGRERIESFDYFASPKLLAPGLFDWSAEAGWLRQDYGRESFGYGPWIASMTARWGATSWLTVEGHAEAAPGLASGGAGVVVGLGVFGAVSAFGTMSRQDAGIAQSGTGGVRLGAGYDWSNGWLNLSAQAELTDPGFADIASLSGSANPSSSWRASAGLDLDAFGSLGLSYVERRYEDRDRDAFLTASYSLPLSTSLNFGVTALVVPDKQEWQISASLSLSLGGGLRTTTRTRFDQDGWAGTTADLASSSRGIDDFGWRASATSSPERNQIYAAATWRTAYGDLSARGVGTDEATLDDSWSVEVGARGALVVAGAGFALSRPIDGAFAIVDVGGVSGVTVRDGNRAVGETGWLGPVIVPDLRPWQENTIAIDALDVPFDVAIDGDRRTVVPAGRAAVSVEFATVGARSVVVTLVDETGRPLPQGAAASADGVRSAFPLGFDGEAYFEDVEESFTIEVSGLWGRCNALVTLPPGPDPHLGPVTCHKS